MWALRPLGRNSGSKDTQHSCRYQSGKGESHDITLSFLSLLSHALFATFHSTSVVSLYGNVCITLNHNTTILLSTQQGSNWSCHVWSCQNLLGDSFRYPPGDSYLGQRQSRSLICCTTLPSKSMLGLHAASLLRWPPPAQGLKLYQAIPLCFHGLIILS